MRFPKIFWGFQKFLSFQDLLRLLPSEAEPGGAQGSQDVFGLRDFLGSQNFLGFQDFLGSFLVESTCPKFP